LSAHISPEDLHPHLAARMRQRGVSREEIEQVLDRGRPAKNVKPGILGKVAIFSDGIEWQGRMHAEKEVTVYYKLVAKRLVVLTVKARYGSGFPRG
jgi:Domain of unknown function (DUF4258)